MRLKQSRSRSYSDLGGVGHGGQEGGGGGPEDVGGIRAQQQQQRRRASAVDSAVASASASASASAARPPPRHYRSSSALPLTEDEKMKMAEEGVAATATAGDVTCVDYPTVRGSIGNGDAGGQSSDLVAGDAGAGQQPQPQQPRPAPSPPRGQGDDGIPDHPRPTVQPNGAGAAPAPPLADSSSSANASAPVGTAPNPTGSKPKSRTIAVLSTGLRRTGRLIGGIGGRHRRGGQQQQQRGRYGSIEGGDGDDGDGDGGVRNDGKQREGGGGFFFRSRTPRGRGRRRGRGRHRRGRRHQRAMSESSTDSDGTPTGGGAGGGTGHGGLRGLSLRSPRSLMSRSHHDRDRYDLLDDEDDDMDDDGYAVVRDVESALRKFLLLVGAFLLGAAKPEFVPVASKALELSCAAWVTCVVILALTFARGRWRWSEERAAEWTAVDEYAEERQRHPVEERHFAREEEPLLRVDTETLVREGEPDGGLTENQLDDVTASAVIPTPRGLEGAIPRSLPITTKAVGDEPTMSHPELEDLYLMNCFTGERIYPNGEPVILDNDLFYGKLLMMVRTSDADGDDPGPSNGGGNSSNDAVSTYFRTKQRRFEFQYQLKLKKVPEGPLFLSADLDEPLKMGMVQRAFVGACLNFVRKMNKGFHNSLLGQDGVDDDALREGRYEKTHLAFTVDNSMDALVATKPGDPLPRLGEPIPEDPESLKRRKRGGKVDWNTEDTYTMGLWSAYIDFLQWRCLNLPGIRPFSLSSVNGGQPLDLTLYILTGQGEQGSAEALDPKHHYVCDKETVTHLEISHSSNSSLGRHAKEWIAKKKVGEVSQPRRMPSREESALGSTSFGAIGIEASGADDLDGVADFAEGMPEIGDDDDDAETLEELGEGMYLRSGDPIVLRESITEGDVDKKQDIFVANGCGFAVLQSQSACTFVIEKAVGSGQAARNEKTSKSKGQSSKLIKSGDAVMVKMIVRNDSQDTFDVKYLSLHRGWWLKWVSNRPKYNGYFRIFSHDAEGELETVSLYSSSMSLEMQMTYVRLGGSFSLQHKRWSRFHVGVSLDSSVKFGGRMLGLHKKGVPAGDNLDIDDDIEEQPPNPFDSVEASGSGKGKKQWMRHIRFCADPASPVPCPGGTVGANPIRAPVPDSTPLHDSKSLVTPPLADPSPAGPALRPPYLDAPAWIEMMHRTKRQRQRAYVVRVRKHAEDSTDLLDNEVGEDKNIYQYSLRLKTGKDLTPVLQLGLRWRGPDGTDASSMATEAPRATQALTENEEIENFNDDSFDEDSIGDASTENKIGMKIISDVEPSTDIRQSVGTSEKGGGAHGSEEKVGEPSRSGGSRQPSHVGNKPRALGEGKAATSNRQMHSLPDLDAILPNASSFPLDKCISGSPRVERRASLDALSDSEVASLELSQEEVEELVDEEYDAYGYVDDLGLPPLNRRKKKWIGKPASGIGKVAKSVKTGTAITGKQVYKQGKKVGKGTVYAGRVASRAIVSNTIVHGNRPPAREPRKKATLLRTTGKDHHKAVNKAVKSLRRSSSSLRASKSNITAGRLCAPDQSCRTVSHILSEISLVAPTNPDSSDILELLVSQAETQSDLDSWFLSGESSVELGVVPAKSEEKLVCESIAARCLWESHWREEWCGLYETRIDFYAPLMKKPSLVLSLADVQSVRRLEPLGCENPLPGLPLLAIETAWRCHYLAFPDESHRDDFEGKLKAAIFTMAGEGQVQNDFWKAHLWQGFSAQSTLSSGRGKWASISSSNKSKQRLILNGRRRAFDVDPLSAPSNATRVEERDVGSSDDAAAFVESLLMKACSFSLESLENSPKEFVNFLDATSRLRSLPLHDLNLSGNQAFCIFLNLYHCLLQHSLLLTTDGPPNKRTVGHFKRCSCYEIGGDVFSLAELECCVLRGRMSKAINAKNPYVEPPKGSRSYAFYALGIVEPRLNFALNNGDLSSLPMVPVYTPELVEEQLQTTTSDFLSQNTTVDVAKRTIFLPKVCEVYRKDFGQGDPSDCVAFCLQYLDEETQAKIIELFTDETNSPLIKYQSSCDSFHTNLQLML